MEKVKYSPSGRLAVFACLILAITLGIVFSVTQLASLKTSLRASSETSLPNDDPILLDSKVIGRQIDQPNSFVPQLSDLELTQALDLSKVTRKQLKLKKLDAGKVESWDTKIEPPREIPLIGKAQLHRTIFTCSIQFVDRDGIERQRTILVEKNQFEPLKSK